MQIEDSVEALFDAMWGAQAVAPLPPRAFAWLTYAASLHREHSFILAQVAALPKARQQDHLFDVLAAYHGLGQKQAARDTWTLLFQQPAAQDPSQEELRLQLGLWAAKLGQIDEAQTLSEALTHPQTPRLIGAIARAKGDHPEAERQFQQAIGANPGILGSYVALAWLYLRCEQPVSGMLHAVAALDQLQEVAMTLREEAPQDLLEVEALWSLKGYFQRAKQRSYTREVSAEIKRRQRRAMTQLRRALSDATPPQSQHPTTQTHPGAAPTPASPSWESLARRHFGIATLRPGQAAVLEQLDAGHNVLAVMPTGAGKSLCYQLPSLRHQGITLVISPLVALMQDQMERLPPALQQKSSALHSGLEWDEQRTTIERIQEGHAALVFVAPERLRNPPFRHALLHAKRPISLMVVDEAHCVSMWGHDFRPDYLALGELHQQLGSPQLLALTATAPAHIKADIHRQLAPKSRLVECSTSLQRNNLWLEVLWSESEPQRDAAITSMCASLEGSGIVYARTRQRCEDLAARLCAHGIQALPYHAGLSDRTARQRSFMDGAHRVVVATIAFGMGIDKPDIRFVIHDSAPRSLEDLTQQVGRAGRDGLPSRCTLIASRSSIQRLHSQAHQAWDLDTMREIYRGLTQEMEPGRVSLFSTGPLAASLGLDETRMRVAISLFVQAGLLVRHEDTPARVFLQRTDRFQKPMSAAPDPAFESFVAQASIPLHGHTIRRTDQLATQLALPLHTIEAMLLTWQKQGLIAYEPRGRRMALSLARHVDQSHSGRLKDLLQAREQCQQQRSEAMLDYLLRDQCRHEAILGYLSGKKRSTSAGSQRGQGCGSCDYCFSD